MEFDIQKALEMFGDGKIQKEVAQAFGMGESTLRGKIKKAGYAKNDVGKYVSVGVLDEIASTSEVEEYPITQQKNKTVKKQTKKPENNVIIKEDNNPSNKPLKKVTYEIEEWLHDELKVKAIREKRKVSEIVNEFIKNGLK
jgi:hypothetical protein